MRIDFDKMIRLSTEVSDTKCINTEWYESLDYWNNYLWTLVNKQEPYKVKENVPTISARVVELSDDKDHFDKNIDDPSCFHISLEKLYYLLTETSYTYVFLEGVGKLDYENLEELKVWLKEKIS